MIIAQIVADSISSAGIRLTSMKLEYPRFIHSELLTHRMFSRNSVSSRAVPFKRMVEKVRKNIAMPMHWGKDCRGMQAMEEIDASSIVHAKELWMDAAESAISYATWLHNLGLHKQVVNRLIEPFMHMQTLVSATEWDNFFALRLDHAAQPEMQALAKAMKEALDNSEPVELKDGEWHMPFINEEDYNKGLEHSDLLKISAARCARVSYFLPCGSRPPVEKDLELYNKLAGSNPKHLSPLEHVAQSVGDQIRYANFIGWRQLRLLEEKCSWTICG